MYITPAINEFIQQNLHTPIEKVVLPARKLFDIDPTFIVDQINGRKKAPSKLPSWTAAENIIFPSIVSMEQCSSEQSAHLKAELIKGSSIIDLTGGFGVDVFFFSKQFKEVDYCERDKNLAKIVAHNLVQLDAQNVRCHQRDGIDFLKNIDRQFDWIYLDPARRDADKNRVYLIEDSEPNIIEIRDLLLSKAGNILVKLSPMLDLDDVIKKVAGIYKIVIVSVKNDCKEILVFINNNEHKNTPIKCINIDSKGQTQSFDSEIKIRKEAKIQLSSPLRYIYEPHRSILKAQAQNHLAEELGLYKLEANSNFFTSEKELANFPGRVFQLIDIVKAKKKFIHKYLADNKANIIARNYPLNAAQLYEKLKIVPGGEHYILATKAEGKGNVLMLCKRLN